MTDLSQQPLGEGGAGSTPPAAAPRILVVDDIGDNIGLLCRRLARHGFATLTAESGKQALEVIAAEPVDLVLLDAMMPEMNGIEVLARLRHTYSTGELPIIMVTAMTQSEDVAHAIALGANDYVTKPIDFVVLLARIRAQLERKHAQEALRLVNLSLERRVAERTVELTDANTRLAGEIEERRASEERMRHMAYHDALTGLPNRVLFRECLERAVEHAKRENHGVGVFCVDLDGFKEINDVHGHPFGDQFLRSVADRIVELVPGSATVARLGGDEFAVIMSLQESSVGALAAIAEQLIAGLQQSFVIHEQTVHVGASIGVSSFPIDGTEPELLLKTADTALYRAKAEGHGIYRMFAPEMNAELERRRVLTRDLKDALDIEQFELYYQPIVSLADSSVIGTEALVRWRHPERGLVAPGAFIPMAEETGLILPLGEWVLRAACIDAASWTEPLKVAVNLSSLHFRRSGVVDLVSRALDESGLDPARLEIEVTESVLLSNSREVLRALQELKALGVSVSLDDFGTGFSALSYLLEYQFDKIKIDRSFVAGLGDSHRADSIVSAVLSLASGLEVITLAEGVETERQAAMLAVAGCQQAQGHYFGRPRPAPAMAHLLDSIAAKTGKKVGEAA